MIQAGAALAPDEARFAAEFTVRGHYAAAKTMSGLGKSADFIISRGSTKLKTICHVKTDSVAKAVTKTIKGATKQAKHVIVDARGQIGLSESAARAAVERAVRDLPKSRVSRVNLLGRDGNRSFEFTVLKK